MTVTRTSKNRNIYLMNSRCATRNNSLTKNGNINYLKTRTAADVQAWRSRGCRCSHIRRCVIRCYGRNHPDYTQMRSPDLTISTLKTSSGNAVARMTIMTATTEVMMRWLAFKVYGSKVAGVMGNTYWWVGRWWICILSMRISHLSIPTHMGAYMSSHLQMCAIKINTKIGLHVRVEYN